MHTPQVAKKKFTAQQRSVLIVAIITSLLTTFMSSSLDLSITAISKEFSTGVTTVTWVVSVFTLTAAALSVPFGHLADLTGRRRILVVGIGVFGISTLLAVFSPSIGWLIGIRVFQAVGAAMIFSSNIPVLLAAFPDAERGRVLGFNVAATYIGLSSGPVFGGLLNATFGWRSILIVTFLFSCIPFVLALRTTKQDSHPTKGEKDSFGALLYVCMIVFVMFGISEWNSAWWAKALLALGIALAFLFLLHEKKQEQPLVQISLFAHDPTYTLSNLAALLNYGATFAIAYTMSLFLQNVQGLSSSTAGLILISQPLTMAILSPLAGSLSDRIAPYKLASFGMGVTACGLFLLSRVHGGMSLLSLILSLVLVGVGFGFFSSPNTNAVLACVDRRFHGEANAILTTMRTLGQSTSMAVVLFLLGANLGNVVISSAPADLLAEAIRSIMRVFGVICIVGVILSLVRGKAKRGIPLPSNPPKN